jgi:hypothetical protein
VDRRLDIDEIRAYFRQEAYELSMHAQQERLEEDLDIVDIEEAIRNGVILENYPDDPRGPSCLILGHAAGRPVHLVVGWARGGEVGRRIPRLITIYEPQPPKWVDPRRRGGRP